MSATFTAPIIELEFDVADDFISSVAWLDELDKRLSSKKFLADGVYYALRIAHDLVHVDTGLLQSTLRVEPIENGFSFSAGYPLVAHYASYGEYGTVRMEAWPYMAPAVDLADRVIREGAEKLAVGL